MKFNDAMKKLRQLMPAGQIMLQFKVVDLIKPGLAPQTTVMWTVQLQHHGVQSWNHPTLDGLIKQVTDQVTAKSAQPKANPQLESAAKAIDAADPAELSKNDPDKTGEAEKKK